MIRAIEVIKNMGFKIGDQLQEEKSYLKYIEENSFSGYHLIGTNRMAESKSKGVVDKKFKVFGTENLFVCDASIFPDLVSTHQYLPTLAVGKMFSLQHKWISF